MTQAAPTEIVRIIFTKLGHIACSMELVDVLPSAVFNPLTANAALPNYPSTAKAVNAVTWVKQ